jgi:hypothetical protein
MTMNLSKLKFSPKDLIIGILIISPVLFLAYKVVNPAEGKLIEADLAKKDAINVLARAVEPYYKENKVYPECDQHGWAECFNTLNIRDHTTDSKLEIAYDTSEDNQEMILYSEVHSLKWRQYCHEGTAYMLFSSVENKTEIVCVDTPSTGAQKFVN